MLNSLIFKGNMVKNLSVIFVSLVYASFAYASNFSLYDTELNKLDLKKTVRVLAIDGGGIRGIIPATILANLEEKLSAEFNRKIHICDCFDIIAGTSTGGIIALALNVPSEENRKLPKYEAKEIAQLYEKERDKIFPKKWGFVGSLLDSIKNTLDPKYPSQGIEEVLQKYFKGHKLQEALTRTLVMAYNLHQNKHTLLDSKEAKNNKSEDFLMRDAARATSAAPTYLSAANIKGMDEFEHSFIDGGITANNPTWKAFEVALKDYPDMEQYFVVSLGTGKAESPNLHAQLAKGGQFNWARYVAPMMMDSASHLVHEAMQKYAKVSPKKVFYSRLQTRLPLEATEMDNTDHLNIKTLLNKARETTESTKYNKVFEFLSYYFERAEGYSRRQNNNIPRALPFNQGMALSLNGINQYAEIPEILDTPFAVGKGAFTMEAWFKTASLSDVKCIFRFGQASPHSDATVALQYGKIIFGCHSIGWSGCSGNLLLSDDKWHHIAYTRDGNIQTVYLDGIEAGQDNKYDPDIKSGYLRIGYNTPGSSPEDAYFPGHIKNVRFWNIARNLSEKQNNFDANNLTLSNDLIAYWSFNEEDKDKAHNLVTDKYHLNLINAPARVKL